jgi:hypothetical protein
MKGSRILSIVVVIGVALGGAYGIANWQAGDTRDDVDKLEERVEAWDCVLSDILSEFEEELTEIEVQGMGMDEEAISNRVELTYKLHEQTISEDEIAELRSILEEERAKAKIYNHPLAVLAISDMLNHLNPKS